MAEDRKTHWVIGDRADGSYLQLVGSSRNSRDRKTAKFGPRVKATSFATPERAASAALLVGEDRFSTIEFVEMVEARRIPVPDTLPPPRNFAVVPSSWLLATRSFSAKDLTDTARYVELRRVDPADLDSVRAIFAEVLGISPAPAPC